VGPLIQIQTKLDENEANKNIQSALCTASTCASVVHSSLVRRAGARMVTSIMTRSLSKLASYISKKLILDRIEDLSCEWSSIIGQENHGSESGIGAKNTQAMSQFGLSGMRIRGVPALQWYASKSCGFATYKSAYVSYFDTSTQYCIVWFDCQMGLANMQCWICPEDMPRILQCTWTSIIWVQKLPLCHKSASRVSYSDMSTWISPSLPYC